VSGPWQLRVRPNRLYHVFIDEPPRASSFFSFDKDEAQAVCDALNAVAAKKGPAIQETPYGSPTDRSILKASH